MWINTEAHHSELQKIKIYPWCDRLIGKSIPGLSFRKSCFLMSICCLFRNLKMTSLTLIREQKTLTGGWGLSLFRPSMTPLAWSMPSRFVREGELPLLSHQCCTLPALSDRDKHTLPTVLFLQRGIVAVGLVEAVLCVSQGQGAWSLQNWASQVDSSGFSANLMV